MSYCRLHKGTSDAYIFPHVKGYLVCMSCKIVGNHGDFKTNSRKEMLEHITKHEHLGHKIPLYAVTRLKDEALEVGDIFE